VTSEVVTGKPVLVFPAVRLTGTRLVNFKVFLGVFTGNRKVRTSREGNGTRKVRFRRR